ncbi:MAG: 50S ribosomal protein L4 [Firmicutes bacterium]|nr:50S ribosomal protein L4 [Bacillota bacterium]
MPTVAVYNVEGQRVGEITLKDEIFAAPRNDAAVHQVVVAQLANRRQGTVDTKTRAEVSGGGRKPWRQKGTGRARQGSIRSPLWVGGGTVFGPHPKDYDYRIPKKVRRLALCSALSAKTGEGNLTVVDQLTLPEAKTRAMAKVLSNLKALDKTLIVLRDPDPAVRRAAGNLPGVWTTEADSLNVVDLVNHAKVVITRDAVSRLEEVLG